MLRQPSSAAVEEVKGLEEVNEVEDEEAAWLFDTFSSGEVGLSVAMGVGAGPSSRMGRGTQSISGPVGWGGNREKPQDSKTRPALHGPI
jgi:hypothetical protein